MKLEESYTKYGWHFKLVKSERLPNTESGKLRYKAIYLGNSKGTKRDNIEVVILKEGVNKFKENAPQLMYPSSNTWGNLGWTYVNMEMAEEKYNQIS